MDGRGKKEITGIWGQVDQPNKEAEIRRRKLLAKSDHARRPALNITAENTAKPEFDEEKMNVGSIWLEGLDSFGWCLKPRGWSLKL